MHTELVPAIITLLWIPHQLLHRNVATVPSLCSRRSRSFEVTVPDALGSRLLIIPLSSFATAYRYWNISMGQSSTKKKQDSNNFLENFQTTSFLQLFFALCSSHKSTTFFANGALPNNVLKFQRATLFQRLDNFEKFSARNNSVKVPSTMFGTTCCPRDKVQPFHTPALQPTKYWQILIELSAVHPWYLWESNFLTKNKNHKFINGETWFPQYFPGTMVEFFFLYNSPILMK